MTWKLVPGFLKQANYIRFVIEELLKFVQIMQTSSDSYLQKIL